MQKNNPTGARQHSWLRELPKPCRLIISWSVNRRVQVFTALQSAGTIPIVVTMESRMLDPAQDSGCGVEGAWLAVLPS